MLAPSVAGPALIAAGGITNDELLAGAWDDAVVRYRKVTTAAFDDAGDVVGTLIGEWRTGYPAAMRATFNAHLDESTDAFVAGLNGIATSTFLDPKGLDVVGDLVPAGFVRHVLAVAGGQTDIQSTGFAFVTVTGSGDGLPGLTTGPTMMGAVRDHGGQVEAYRWVYGPAMRRQNFHPHLRLGGVTFKNFDDPKLVNGVGWPPFSHYVPGDHAGCRCDAEPILLSPAQASALGVAPDVPLTARELAAQVRESSIVDAAAKHNVSTDEVRAAMPMVKEVRRAIADDAAATQARAFAILQRGGGNNVFLPRPPRKGLRLPDGRLARGADWDWLEGLTPEERDRLGRAWFTDTPIGLDVVAEDIARGLGGETIRNAGTGEIIEDVWLRANREIEAAGAVRKGRIPVSKHYSYSPHVDPANLAPNVEAQGIDTRFVLGANDEDVAGYLARQERDQISDEASSALGREAHAAGDAAPWRMSFQSWESEVREIEYVMREVPDDLTPAMRERYDALVPAVLDTPGLDYESLYSVIIQTANLAEADVAPWARIPWA